MSFQLAIMAATSILVADLSLQLVSASESGSGRTLIFVKFIISKRPTAVLADGGVGAGWTKVTSFDQGQLAEWLVLLLL